MLAGTRQPVSRSELIDGVWGIDAPRSAENSVHVHICGLRRAVEPGQRPRGHSHALTAAGTGYRLVLAANSLDTEVLAGHLADARRWAARYPAAGLQSLNAALSLWQGASLTGVPGPWADIERARLDALRETAIAGRVEIMLRLGQHHQVLPELAALVRQYPLREQFREQLMLALYRCGRQAEALAVFADARRYLAEDLGIDAGPALRRLQRQILTSDPALDQPRLGAPGSTGHGDGIRTPHPVRWRPGHQALTGPPRRRG
jgi:DNA-binding SARP family transcriptional activator